MKEHLSAEQIEHLVSRRAAPEDILLFTRHSATCEACRVAIDRQFRLHHLMSRRLTALHAELDPQKDPPAPHLTYDQIAGFIERTLNETHTAVVEQHLSLCSQCAIEARELRDLRDELKRDAAEAPPAARPPAPARTVRPKGQTSRLAPPAARDHWRRPMGWALACSLTAILIGAELWVSHVLPGGGSRKLIAPLAPSPNAPLARATPLPTKPLIDEEVLSLLDHDRRVRMNRAGAVTGLPELPDSLFASVKRVLATQRLDIPAAELQSLRGRGATLLGGKSTSVPDAIKLLKPVGAVLLDDQPTFRWVPVPGAEQYTVTLLNADFNPVIETQPVAQNSWRPALPLPRNRTYVWQVTAEINGKRISSSSATAPEARFKILSAEQTQELRRAQDLYRDSHLVLGTLYAQAGLLEDAAREFQALASANPDSTLARELLRQTRK